MSELGNPYYKAIEKIPEIDLVNYDTSLEAKLRDEQRQLLHHSKEGDPKHKQPQAYRWVMVAFVALLLTSVVITLGAVKMTCSSKNHDPTHGGHVSTATGIFGRIVVPQGWKEGDSVTKISGRSFTWKQPQAWPGKAPPNDLGGRDIDGHAEDSWKSIIERKPNKSLDKKNTRTDGDWKNPKGWKGRIGGITKRGFKVTSTPSVAGSTTGAVGSAAQQISNSLTSAINASVTIPLYSYPGDGAREWNPVFNALNSSSTIKFTIVINPNNGPGSGAPDANFQTGIKKLKSFPNAKVFGYVHQSYGSRSIAAVEKDLLTYASWASPNTGIFIDGIFFDESPTDKTYAGYVATVNTFAKAQGLSTTIQNAGTIPDKAYFQPTQNTDITVIMEDSYFNYTAATSQYNGLDTKYGVPKSAFSYIIYDAPTNAQAIKMAVTKMAQQVGHVFMTDLSQDDAYLDISGDTFIPFVAAMVKALTGS
ncbi:Spherulin-4 [Arthrobotrys entomopaga]|nr:Spherulin-4 [Arthrobotrys entomopaga]